MLTLSRRLLGTPILALFITSATFTLQAQEAPLKGLDAYIDGAIADWGVPGLAVAVVKDGKIVHAKGYGVREHGKEAKVDAHTLFAIASNSKAFTCAALSILVDEKKLSWDDRASEILPWFQLHDANATRDIRALDLVTHRSGLPTFGGDHLWIGSKKKRREVLRRIRYLEPSEPFRMKYQYQNIMYTAAGELIEAKTGKTWSEFVRARILDPLGMKETTLSITTLADKDNVAAAHEVRHGKLQVVEYDNVDAVAAAAGINSSVIEMAQWLRMNLAGGMHDGKQILGARSIAQMQSVHMAQNVGFVDRMHGRHFHGYGLGWALTDDHGKKAVAHGGGLTGMISRTYMIPEEGLGIVVLTNQAMNFLPRVVTHTIVDRYLGLEDQDWNARYLNLQKRIDAFQERTEAQVLATKIKGTTPSIELSAYVGDYHNPLPGKATVSLKDGKLYFFYNRRHRGFLEHWHHDTFRIEWIEGIMDMDAKAFMSFTLDAAGKVESLRTTWYHPITFDRK